MYTIKYLLRTLIVGIILYFGFMVAGVIFHTWLKAFILGWNFVKN